ncbi:MAG: hypothetical protein ACJ73S_11815 [Mycobacteriales bacterium]
MRRSRALAVVAVVAVIAGGAVVAATLRGQGAPAARPAPTVSVPAAADGSPYATAVDAAHAHGLRVWLETDLVKQWLAGPSNFQVAVDKVGALARRPGVVGIKYADEMGYDDGLDSVDKIRKFVAQASAALHRVAPGKQLLIDLLVPELGCLPDHEPPLRWATICQARARGDYPALAMDHVDQYLRGGGVDVLDLSTGLQPDRTYDGWGVDRDEAQRTAWAEVRHRGWDKLVRLQARKALAHSDDYRGAAEPDLTTWVDVPRSGGAHAIDVWTWRQAYQGKEYRLLDPGLRPNALWTALRARRAGGDVLFTHFSPSSVEVGLDADLAVLAQVFTDVFVAAGTG